MIDWQILIDGSFPVGWDRERDGCWFPDFEHQEFLLPYFDVGETPIDEYGGTTLDAADLARLKSHLEHWRGHFESKPDEWSITETVQNQSTTKSLQRAKILAVIDKTLMMIDSALSQGGVIKFFGD